MEIVKKTELGDCVINSKAIEDIAQIATLKVNDVYPNKKENKFATLKHKDKDFYLELFIKVKQNIDINKTCEEIQSKVYEQVYESTGIKIKHIDINIQGFIN